MSAARWTPGVAPVAVVMIARDEAHQMEGVLANLAGWAAEVFLVDSYSTDATVDVALRHGVHVEQRRFRGFGDQWGFALRELPITAPWTLKLDPDERLSDALKAEIAARVVDATAYSFRIPIRLRFMGRPLPQRLLLTRLWRTGRARVAAVTVNEHLVIEGDAGVLRGEIDHLDSPDLHRWMDKQNRYTTLEAQARHGGAALAATANPFGDWLERRMWLKANFTRLPFRYVALHMYHLFGTGAWRAGRAGWAWARLRTEVFRLQEYKQLEMRLRGASYGPPPRADGAPHPGAARHHD